MYTIVVGVYTVSIDSSDKTFKIHCSFSIIQKIFLYETNNFHFVLYTCTNDISMKKIYLRSKYIRPSYTLTFNHEVVDC